MESSQVKKHRKKRKPMTPEQRQAAAERLALAREKKLKENPPKNLSLHSSIRDLPESDPLHPKKVRQWIKTQKDLRASYRREVRANTKGAQSRLSSCDGYIKNMERYLRNGEWVDMFFGEHQTNKIKYKVSKKGMAYYSDGTPKRTVGYFYEDIGCEWTKELSDEIHK